jgi:hypothetical protein
VVSAIDGLGPCSMQFMRQGVGALRKCQLGMAYDGDPVAVNFVSFNDFSSIGQCDPENPCSVQFSKFPDEDYAITIAASLAKHC